MARRKYINPVTSRILIFIIILVSTGALAFFIYNSVKKELNPLIFNIGKRGNVEYEETIIKTYDEYLKIKKQYNINSNLKEIDFDNNYYIAYFDEYNNCSEKKYKSIEAINYDNKINITFKVYSKCGFCESDIILYLIKIKKTNLDVINYNYVSDKKLECGNI